MGYYYQHKLGFSFHDLQRIREQIPLFKNENDWIIKDKIIKMIDNYSDRIETRSNLYIKLDDLEGNLYVVVEKQQRLIVTVTQMSPKKLLDVITQN
ncbi:hypothetical protein D6D54_00575 [Spiroplasma poulsonii]|uniref:DUF4258 domain-containing protein n=1 Tax=Spiroplasma poulsonii TaxID=2138 RepID=A0A433ET15_9MOLU|nr:hypothetical protein [Spiroplasma poulsonii]MBW3057859.1 hypothetical protein [Spiroplasma poulsonii]MBW3057901.1 hypothetical protein [Spiroplasma poulsonii]RUP78017.1 hypothetical protein D6D54_00575 [Spiroplasma poulsonii]